MLIDFYTLSLTTLSRSFNNFIDDISTKFMQFKESIQMQMYVYVCFLIYRCK